MCHQPSQGWLIGVYIAVYRCMPVYVWFYDTNSNFTDKVPISEKSNIRSLAISADPIRRETCNPAGGEFCRIVEIQPDPDSRSGYPSIPNTDDVKMVKMIVAKAYGLCDMNEKFFGHTWESNQTHGI